MTNSTSIDIEEISGEIEGEVSAPQDARAQLRALAGWFGKRRQGLKPWTEFMNAKRFSKPKDIAEVGKRVVKNLEHYQTNYIMVCLILLAYCIITSPMLLFALTLFFGACFYINQRGQGQPLVLFGRSFSTAEQYALVLTISIPLFFLASAGSAVFWVIGASVFFVGLHASLLSLNGEAIPELEMDPVI